MIVPSIGYSIPFEPTPSHHAALTVTVVTVAHRREVYRG